MFWRKSILWHYNQMWSYELNSQEHRKDFCSAVVSLTVEIIWLPDRAWFCMWGGGWVGGEWQFVWIYMCMCLMFYTQTILTWLFSFKVPSLNEVPLHYLKPNSFVKFRCMVQDMFDPEFYMGVYETVNRNTKARVCIAFFMKLSVYN